MATNMVPSDEIEDICISFQAKKFVNGKNESRCGSTSFETVDGR